MDPLVVVKDLRKYFSLNTFGQRGQVVKAVDGVSFTINKGENFALVGESGSGKTTTGKLLLHLQEPTSGTVYFDGVDIYKLNKGKLRDTRKSMQMVYQNALLSFNPRKTIQQILSQPFRLHGVGKKQEVDEKVVDLMNMVGLVPAESFLTRHPVELSGGQRQRVDIARAIALTPKFIVADEPVSALDTSVRALILNLFMVLQKELDLTYLFITHDMAVVRTISDRIAIMYLGEIVESGTVEEVFRNPAHPYTIVLLSATPVPEPEAARSRNPIILRGTMPSPINPPSGCRFRTRCPLAIDRCAEPVAEISLSDSHVAKCIYADELFSGKKTVH